jgi:hypothetical protein
MIYGTIQHLRLLDIKNNMKEMIALINEATGND